MLGIKYKYISLSFVFVLYFEYKSLKLFKLDNIKSLLELLFIFVFIFLILSSITLSVMLKLLSSNFFNLLLYIKKTI